MPDKAVYVFVMDGFADWEPAHALAELRRSGGYRIETVGLTASPVESMGGLHVMPTTTVNEVDPSDVAAFVLPGGDRWEKSPVEPELASLLKRIDEAGIPIGAICAATTAIAKVGLLKDRRHTSNGLAYMQSKVPGYDAASNYVAEPAVRDRKLITASGLADIEFARELFEELGVLSAQQRGMWASMFRSGRVPEKGA